MVRNCPTRRDPIAREKAPVMEWTLHWNELRRREVGFLPQNVPQHNGTALAGTYFEVVSKWKDHWGDTLAKLELVDGRIIDGITIEKATPVELSGSRHHEPVTQNPPTNSLEQSLAGLFQPSEDPGGL